MLTVAMVAGLGAGTAALQIGFIQLGEQPQVAVQATAPVPRHAPKRGAVSALPAHPGITMNIDGEPRGDLPLTVNDLPPGEHTIVFTAGDKYRAQEKRVDVVAGETLDLGRIELELLEGSVLVTVDDPGTEVWLRDDDGNARPLKGPWPRTIDLKPGDYELIFAKYGYRSQIRPVHITASSAEHTINVTLRPKGALKRDVLEL